MSAMTEEEAKTKGCCGPLTAFLASGVISYMLSATSKREGAQIGDMNNKCVASHCMAWRWRVDKTIDDGYCGLAGKDRPE